MCFLFRLLDMVRNTKSNLFFQSKKGSARGRDIPGAHNNSAQGQGWNTGLLGFQYILCSQNDMVPLSSFETPDSFVIFLQRLQMKTYSFLALIWHLRINDHYSEKRK